MYEEMTTLHTWHCGGIALIPDENYKRAVLRPAPSRFTVDFLPVDYNASHNHGIRVAAVSSDTDTITSAGSIIEYQIWRKWEDFLWLQDDLEREYSRAAREKKTRLAQGKGVKSYNGMYKQDMASSWESLPPGPDPNSVAADIHTYLPRLKKKGTIFKANHSLIDQRQKDIENLVKTLFSSSMPALIQELRESTHARDFFSLWRRDYDLLEKLPKNRQRMSVTSSVFSLYFSDSSTLSVPSSPPTNFPQLPNSPTRKSSRRPRSSGTACTGITEEETASTTTSRSVKRLSDSSDEGSTLRSGMASLFSRTRPRALSSTSSESSSEHSDASVASSVPTTSHIPTIVDDNPVQFDFNPQIPTERPSSILEVLPEQREMLAKSPESYLSSPPRRVRKTSSDDRKSHRTWTVVGTPPAPASISLPDDQSARDSWQSSNSGVSDIMEELGLSFADSRDRSFRSSISTFMTTDSADAVLRENTNFEDYEPRDSRPPRISTAVTLSDFDIYSDVDDSSPLHESFSRPISYSMTDRPETPTWDCGRNLSVPTTPTTPQSASPTSISFPRPPSPTSSVVSSVPTITTISTVHSTTNSLSIKAAHNGSIIMLKASRDLPFEEVRQRLYNKFVGQEGIPLSKDFSVALVVPTTPSFSKSPVTQRPRSSSVSGAEKMELHFIDDQFDWDDIILAKESNKVSLRILDAPKS